MKLNFIISLLVFSLFLSGCKMTDKAIIYQTNGAEKTGVGQIVKDKVRFLENGEDNIQTYRFDELEKVKIYKQDEIITFVFIKVKNYNTVPSLADSDFKKEKALEVAILGKVGLYREIVYYDNLAFNDNTTMPRKNLNASKNFYVMRKTEKKATFLGSSNGFKKYFRESAIVYFSDCPSLVKKIKNKELGRDNVREIVEYYNAKCSE